VDRSVADFFHGEGIPTAKADGKLFKDMVAQIKNSQPAYKVSPETMGACMWAFNLLVAPCPGP